MKSPLKKRVFKVSMIALAIIISLTVVAALGGAYWLQTNAKNKAEALLKKRFEHVELEALGFEPLPSFSPLPTFTARGRGLRVSPHAERHIPPLVSMEEFSVEIGLIGLLNEPVTIRSLQLSELLIQITPREKNDVEDRSSSSAQDEMPPPFLIENLIADGAVLRIFPKESGKDPLQFDLHELHLQAAGPQSPMEFESLLKNAKPPGMIRTQGTFGPFNLRDPGTTQLEGKYTFNEADLSVFGGIGGMLYSEGTFGGILEKIDVEGFTETPEFVLREIGTPVPLHTEFNAEVDGTSGDTFLEPVRVRLAESTFETRGGVYERVEKAGKTVELKATSSRARVEDFLRLVVKSQDPFLAGDIAFNSNIVIPPGDTDVIEKIQLDGDFDISSARFLHKEVEKKVRELSALGRGERGEPEAEEEVILSDIRGDFSLNDGTMTIDRLLFAVPGSRVYLTGTYNLPQEELDFEGELRTNAKVSQMTKGWKSLLLKPIDPLFSRDDAGAVIPISITGTMSDVSFKVEKMRILTRKEVASP